MKRSLFALLVAGLVGCGGSGGDGGDSSGSTTTGSSSRVLVSDAISINEGQYYAIGFRLNRNADVKTTVTVLDGPAIEGFLVSEREYNAWVTITQGNQFTNADLRYYPDLSISPVATHHESKWGRLEQGTYYFILENTDYGSTLPPINMLNDKTFVEFSISAK